MHLKRWVLVLMLAGVSLIGGCYFGYGSVAGYVYTLSESPDAIQVGGTAPPGCTVLADATVSVTGSETVAYTNAQGLFQISQVAAGPQTLTVSTADGLNMTKRKVVLQRNKVVSYFTRPSWTVLVYMAADNNLTAEALKDLNEMEQVGSTADLNVVVQYDGYANGDSRRYYMTQDSDSSVVHSPVIEPLGEVDMSDPAVLQSFVAWGVTSFPSDHVMLILWDHGAGVWPESVQAQGIAFDDHSGWNACLTTTELRTALSGAKQATGVKVDVLAFDACLMQMMEVGYELQGLADYMAGSEEVTPGDGFPYHTILAGFRGNPALTPRSAATMLVNRFIDYYQKAESVCMSVVDLVNWAPFTARVKNLATALDSATSRELDLIQSASLQTQRFDYHENADLYDFALHTSQLSVNSTLRAAANDVLNYWDQAVIFNERTTQADTLKDGHGLSVLLPTSAHEMSLYGSYDQLLWSADSRWDEFLAKLPLK